MKIVFLEKLLIKKTDEIAQSLSLGIEQGKIENLKGLYNGKCGILLFLYYYSKYKKNPYFSAITDSFLDQLLEEISEEIDHHSFCSGLSGILYMFQFLKEKKIVDIDFSETEKALENYLIHKMRMDISSLHYDFMHGALGVGLYFMKKSNDKVIPELIDFLDKTAEKDKKNNIYKWKSILDSKTNEAGFNIALCHGISSIVLFLSRVIKKGFGDKKIFELLEGAVNYILSQEIDSNIYGSCFPYQSKQKISGSRLAWCYGDLGVSYALWFAGITTNNSHWKDKGLEVLIKSTRRLSPYENGVVDAGICHGCAGIAMVYRRMYLETQLPVFLSSTRYWLNQCLNFANYKDGLAGYKTHGNEEKDDYGLLTGIAGIGLIFISYLTNDNQRWDELLLM